MLVYFDSQCLNKVYDTLQIIDNNTKFKTISYKNNAIVISKARRNY